MTCLRDARIPLQSHTGTSGPGQKDTRQVNELRRKSQTPSSAPPVEQPEQPQGEPAPHPAASLHVFPRDPFKELAELRGRKRPRAMAWGPAGQDPFRRRPDAFKPNVRKDAPPPRAEAKPSSPPAPAPTPQSGPAAPAVPPPLLLIPPGEVFLDQDAAVGTPSGAPLSAAALAPEAPAPAPSAARPEPTARRDYYGRGGSGGSGGGDPPKPKRFDQDDIAAAIMALLLLLAIGWGAMSLLGHRSDGTDDRRLLPQSAAIDPEPAPAPDPFAGAPVDLTPRSVLPAVPSEDPSPVPEAVSPQTALAAAPQPDTAAAPGTAPTCDPSRVVRAYFCTAKADLTPQSRAALERQIKEMGSCTDGREWVVRGFTDTRGAETFNTELAARRAASVASVLRSSGLTVTEVVGVGKLTDMEQGQNCANQRRVDVSLKTSLPPSNRACAPLPEDEALICP